MQRHLKMGKKKVRIIFILPNDCETESQSSNEMQQAFEVCKQNGINVDWHRERESSDLQLNETDFVVFQMFEGEAFDTIKQTESVGILGPRFLLTCLTERQKILAFPWPVYSAAMMECRITCSTLPKAMKKEIQDKIEYMAGHCTPSLLKRSTHLVTDSVKSEKYIKAAEAGVKLLLSSWVDDVWEASQNANIHCDDKQFEKHRCPTFHKLVVCCTGLSLGDRNILEKMITENGGIYQEDLHFSSTDILVCVGSSDKYEAAKKHNIKCVTFQWVNDSIENGYAMPDNLFSFKVGTSTPTKEAEDVDPNFCQEDTLAKLLEDASSFNTNQSAQNPDQVQGNELEPLKNVSSNSQRVETDNFNASLSSAVVDTSQLTIDPLYQGLRFIIVGFEVKQQNQIKTTIEAMAGKVVSKTYKGVPDYAVVPVFNSELKQVAAEVVTDWWITECWLESELVNIEYFHRPISIKDGVQPLNNCVVTISTYTNDERNFLKIVITALGGIFQEQFSRITCSKTDVVASTHLVSPEANGRKYTAAIKWGVPVVNKDWLLECARTSQLVSESSFLVGEAKCPSRSVSNRSSENENVMDSISKANTLFTRQLSSPKPSTSHGSDSPHQFAELPANLTSVHIGEQSVCSQVTPVRDIIAEARKRNLLGTPQHSLPRPLSWDHVDTPDSPLGAFIRPNPSPHLRKQMVRFLNTLPGQKYIPRRESTPWSELKRQWWDKIRRPKNSEQAHKPDPPNFDVEDEVFSPPKSSNNAADVPADDGKTPFFTARAVTVTTRTATTHEDLGTNARTQQLEEKTVAHSMTSSATRQEQRTVTQEAKTTSTVVGGDQDKDYGDTSSAETAKPDEHQQAASAVDVPEAKATASVKAEEKKSDPEKPQDGSQKVEEAKVCGPELINTLEQLKISLQNFLTHSHSTHKKDSTEGTDLKAQGGSSTPQQQVKTPQVPTVGQKPQQPVQAPQQAQPAGVIQTTQQTPQGNVPQIPQQMAAPIQQSQVPTAMQQPQQQTASDSRLPTVDLTDDSAPDPPRNQQNKQAPTSPQKNSPCGAALPFR